ncbi:hypothetical protein HDV00_009416 [Rhizophlyctis rosea]|nr:hypothetical protein HDV00_009416 [Rhizophlyctis rosea]
MTLPAPKRSELQWTDEEDVELFNGVVKHGKNWTAIRKDEDFDILPQRTAVDLKDRYRSRWPDKFYSLNPPHQQTIAAASPPKAARVRRPFSDKESLYLLFGFLKYGHQWARISEHIHYPFNASNRTGEDLRFRFRNIKKQCGWQAYDHATLNEAVREEVVRLRNKLERDGTVGRDTHGELWSLDVPENGEVDGDEDGVGGMAGAAAEQQDAMNVDDAEGQQEEEKQRQRQQQEEETEEEEEEEIPLQRIRKDRAEVPHEQPATIEVPSSVEPPKRRALPWEPRAARTRSPAKSAPARQEVNDGPSRTQNGNAQRQEIEPRTVVPDSLPQHYPMEDLFSQEVINNDIVEDSEAENEREGEDGWSEFGDEEESLEGHENPFWITVVPSPQSAPATRPVVSTPSIRPRLAPQEEAEADRREVMKMANIAGFFQRR